MIKGIRLFSAVSLLLLLSGQSFAQPVYSISSIKPELIKNASAVIRLSEETIEIKSVSSATSSFRAIISILNEDARSFSVYTGTTDKFSVDNFGKITIYDQEGKKVKSFGSGHLEQIPVNSINIYEDNRYYRLDPDYRTYPFTVEIEYSTEYKGLFYLPAWYRYSGYNVSTEKDVLTVITPKDYKLRYFEKNGLDPVKITPSSDRVTYRWEVNGVEALVEEPLSESLTEHSPSVYLAPADFEIGGTKGNSDSWKSFGEFMWTLNKDRNILTGTTIDKVKDIVSSTTDTTEIIRQLYRYFQDRTRYVSIQIGIGGWQPISAQKVDETSYGDCKALSNYMKTLLDIAGIKSHYTLIKAGDNADNILGNFPSNQFNHAILCVPRVNDTIWLECTSQNIPFNYLGDFTDDRHALSITSHGGVLVKTPKYNSEQNKLIRKAYVNLDATGNGTATVSTEYKYYFYDNKVGVISLDQEGRKKSITNSIDIPGFSLVNFSVSQPDKDKPVLSEDLTIKLTKYATLMGDRLLVPVNLMNRIERLPSNAADRKMNIEFMRERMLTDTITYKIPLGYSVPSVPQPMEFTSPFGHYKAEVTLNGNEIVYTRCIRYNKGTFPASDYPKLLEFYKNISTADNTKVALKRSL